MTIPTTLRMQYRVNPDWLVCWRYANGDDSSDMREITFKSLYMVNGETLRTPDMLVPVECV